MAGAIALFVIATVGVCGYMALEGYTALEALWMVVITLTTIGFGEVRPLSAPGKMFTLVLIVGGVSVGGWVMGAATRWLLDGSFALNLRSRRRRRMRDQLDQHFIVVGYGRLGRTVAHELRDAGLEVCVVERGAEAVMRAESDGFPVVEGEGSENAVLLEAGLQRARGVAVASPAGAEAIFVTLSVRQIHPDVPIVTRINSAGELEKARRAGATSTVSPQSMGGVRMAHGLMRPHSSSFLDQATLTAHHDIQLDEVRVPPGSSVEGRTLAQLAIHQRFGVLVIGVRDLAGATRVAPEGDTVLRVGDVVIAIGGPGTVRRFAQEVDPTWR